ncbi:hypothetical protein Bca101_043124 [Brassica carinata]
MFILFYLQFFLQMKHKTVQFPKSAGPDLINQSGHQVSQNSFILLVSLYELCRLFFGFLELLFAIA